MNRVLEGQCHCGGVRVRLETALEDDAIETRACQCGFCTGRAAITMSDPAGAVAFSSAHPLIRYRFASRTADFLICPGCGTYLGAAIAAPQGQFRAIVNVRGVRLHGFAPRAPVAMDYDGETPDAKRARRLAKWTPARILEGDEQ